jgi:hypothetical protein
MIRLAKLYPATHAWCAAVILSIVIVTVVR